MSPLYEVNLRTSVRRGSEHKMYIFVTANFCYIQECTHCTDSKQIGWMAAMNKMNNVDEPNSADKCLCCAFGIVKCVWPWPRMMERQDYYVGKMWNANMIFKYMMLMGKLNCAEIKQRVKFSGEWLPLCSVNGWTNNTGAHHRRSIFLLLLFFCVQRIKQREIRNFCISGYSNTRRGHSPSCTLQTTQCNSFLESQPSEETAVGSARGYSCTLSSQSWFRRWFPHMISMTKHTVLCISFLVLNALELPP